MITNSLQYTEKGYIKLQIYEISDTNCILFEIEDTGIGIKEDILESICKIQPWGIYNHHNTGKGFGLWLCNRITN